MDSSFDWKTNTVEMHDHILHTCMFLYFVLFNLLIFFILQFFLCVQTVWYYHIYVVDSVFILKNHNNNFYRLILFN